MTYNKDTILIVANWKMHKSVESANNFLKQFLSYDLESEPDVVICPPFTLMSSVREQMADTSVALGAQDCSHLSQDIGAFTGDVSAQMLQDLVCDYVIIGHSERRKYHDETNQIIRQKIINAHKFGLKTILCLGEALNAREDGSFKEVLAQILSECLPDCATPDNTIIAYEPIWAIGTGKTASIEQIEDIHQFLLNVSINLLKNITQTFEQNIKIIYGGSVNEKNAKSILSAKNVSGLLVGGASLDPEKFYQIIRASKQ
jgi:triosephosphate isomerase